MKLQHTTLKISGLKKPLRLFHITDTHLTKVNPDEIEILQIRSRERIQRFARDNPRPTHEILADFLKKAAEVNSDCIVITGDLMDFPSVCNLSILGETMKGRIPVLFTPGNHEWYLSECHNPLENEVWELYRKMLTESMGCDTDFCTLELGGVLLIGVDDADYQLTEEQLRKTEEALNRGVPCLLFCHIPFYTSELCQKAEKAWWGKPIVTGCPEEVLNSKAPEDVVGLTPSETTKKFIQLIKNAENLKGIFTGHLHFWDEEELAPGLPQYVTSCGVFEDARIVDLVPEDSEE